jgi:hypothetical protein
MHGQDQQGRGGKQPFQALPEYYNPKEAQWYDCSVSLGTMQKPVVLTCGHSFDETSLNLIGQRPNPACPICRTPIPPRPWNVNFALKEAIVKHRQEREFYDTEYQKIQLRAQTLSQQLQAEHTAKIEALNAAHQKAIEQAILQQDGKTQIKIQQIKITHQTEVQTLKKQHDSQIANLEAQHQLALQQREASILQLQQRQQKEAQSQALDLQQSQSSTCRWKAVALASVVTTLGMAGIMAYDWWNRVPSEIGPSPALPPMPLNNGTFPLSVISDNLSQIVGNMRSNLSIATTAAAGVAAQALGNIYQSFNPWGHCSPQVNPAFQSDNPDWRQLLPVNKEQALQKEYTIKTHLSAARIMEVLGSIQSSTPLTHEKLQDLREILKKMNLIVNSPFNKDSTKSNFFIDAIKNKHNEVVDLFIEAGKNIEEVAMDGATPLMRACYYNNLYAAQKLLEAKANVNFVRKKDDMTALIIACVKGDLRLVTKLIEAGANVNIRSQEGSALDFAKAYKKDKIVAALRKAGARR